MDFAEYGRLARSACFVCRIVAGDPLVPGVEIIDEDDFSISFLNQFPTKEGYTLVCPKRHVERLESDLTGAEWARLQRKVHAVAGAVSAVTRPMRVYVASLGSPELNSHLHVHVCPCPRGTPLEKQQLAAMDAPGGVYLNIAEARMAELADQIRRELAARS